MMGCSSGSYNVAVGFIVQGEIETQLQLYKGKPSWTLDGLGWGTSTGTVLGGGLSK